MQKFDRHKIVFFDQQGDSLKKFEKIGQVEDKRSDRAKKTNKQKKTSSTEEHYFKVMPEDLRDAVGPLADSSAVF